MPTLREALDSAYSGIDAYVAQNPEAHNYANVEAAKAQLHEELTRMAKWEPERLAKLNLDSVSHAATQHLDYMHEGLSEGFMKPVLAQNLTHKPPVDSSYLKIKPLQEVRTLSEVVPDIGKAVSTKRGTTTIDLTKLTAAEKTAFVEYASHHPQLKPLGITATSTQAVLPKKVTLDTIKSLPTSMMLDTTAGKLSVKKPFVPPVSTVTEQNANVVLESLTHELKATSNLSPELIEKAREQAKKAIYEHVDAGNSLGHTPEQMKALLHEQAELIGHAQNGVLPHITDTTAHMAGRLEGTAPTLAEHLAMPEIAERLSLHTELEKLKPTMVDFDRKKKAIGQLLEQRLGSGELTPQKMEQVVTHLASQEAGHLEGMITHSKAAQVTLQRAGDKLKLVEELVGYELAKNPKLTPKEITQTAEKLAGQSPSELRAAVAAIPAGTTPAALSPKAKGAVQLGAVRANVEKVEGLIESGKKIGLSVADASVGHPRLESLIKSPVPTTPAAYVPEALTAPKKRAGLRKWFGANAEEKLYKSGTALEAARAEQSAAEIAFVEQRNAAQKIAFEVEQHKQAAAAAQKEVDALKEALKAEQSVENIEKLRIAQEKALKAQQQVLEGKTRLNQQAKVVVEHKQNLTTLTEATKNAEHSFATVEARITGQKPPEPPKKAAAYDRTAKDRALDRRAADLSTAEDKVATAERKLASVQTGAESTISRTASDVEKATKASEKASETLAKLQQEKAALTSATSTADRAANALKIKSLDAQIAKATKAQTNAQKAVITAQKRFTAATKPTVGAAIAAGDTAHRATLDGMFTNSETSLNHTSKATARQMAAEHENIVSKVRTIGMQGMNGGMVTHTSEQIADIAANRAAAAAANVAEQTQKPGLLKRIWQGMNTPLEKQGGVVGWLGRRGEGAMQIVEKTPGALASAGLSTLEHSGNALSKAGSALKSGAGHFHGAAGNLVLAGAAGVGLLGLGAALSTPARAVARMPKFDDGPTSSNSLAFAGGNTTVDVGGVAMPQLGMSQGQSNWMSRMPAQGSVEEQMLMSSSLPPSR